MLTNDLSAQASPLTREIESLVETLLILLREQLRHARRIAELVRRRLLAEARGDLPRRDECLELEKEALLAHAHAERERIAALTEIGLLLGIARPSRLRIAHLVLHVRSELRDELLDVREDLRDIADGLSGLRSWGGQLEHHYLGRVTLYLSPAVAESRGKRWLIDRLRAESRARDRETDAGGEHGRAETSLSEENG